MRWLALCLFLFGMAMATGQAPEGVAGRPITRIEFEPQEQPLPRSELESLLPLKPGSPLRPEDVRSALQALYQTGRFRDIAVDAQAEGDGVVLRIITESIYFISGVTVEGALDPPNSGQLSTAAKLALGTPVTQLDIDQARGYLLERLSANGLRKAQIVDRVERTLATQEADVLFQVDAGQRAHFAEPTLAGNFDRSPSSIIRLSDWRRSFLRVPLPGWREMTDNRLQNGIQKILEDMQKRDHLQGRVMLDALEYDPDLNRIRPKLTIDIGPLIEVKVTGAKLSKGRMRQLIPIYQERTVDRDLLVEGRLNLLEQYQSNGYFDAKVDFQQSQPEPDRSLIEFKVDLGLRHKLLAVEISGNKYFDYETLRERMYLRPASFVRTRYGRFSQRFVEQDKSSIRDLYRANGFREAEVTSTISDDDQGKQGTISVALEVKEGSQWFVNKLEITGALAEDEEYLRANVQSTEGQPYSESNVAADRDTILTYYYNNGYPNALFEWVQDEVEAHKVDLRFQITPGQRQYVRGVLVRGLDSTDPALVQERILIAAGDAISQRTIGESQQKLYDLGIFSKVQTAIQNPDSEETRKYVLFHLEEARKYSVNVGFGAEIARIGGGSTSLDYPAGRAGFAPRASLGLSRLNLLGLGHTLGVQTLASSQRQRALFNYIAPQFIGRDNLALTFSFLFDNARDVRTFSSRRLEGSVQLSQRLSRANSTQYRYTFRRVTQSNLNIDPSLIPLLSQPDLTGLIGGSFIQDRRDDPINSTRGKYNTIDVGLSHAALGSIADFTRVLLRNSTYTRIGRELVLARSLQFGYIQRFGGVPQIPLAERFFAGGASSHRAFPDNQAGPRDLTTGFPLGGSALLFHSTELRFPLIGDNIGGVFFHDMGNVYSEMNRLSLRYHQRDLQDFDYMVHAVGLGIRYRTPIGPIRVDFSLSPNSPRFNGFVGTREELLAGRRDQLEQRINVFQFHFSLGQTF